MKKLLTRRINGSIMSLFTESDSLLNSLRQNGTLLIDLVFERGEPSTAKSVLGTKVFTLSGQNTYLDDTQVSFSMSEQ